MRSVDPMTGMTLCPEYREPEDQEPRPRSPDSSPVHPLLRRSCVALCLGCSARSHPESAPPPTRPGHSHPGACRLGTIQWTISPVDRGALAPCVQVRVRTDCSPFGAGFQYEHRPCRLKDANHMILRGCSYATRSDAGCRLSDRIECCSTPVRWADARRQRAVEVMGCMRGRSHDRVQAHPVSDGHE